MHEYVLCWYTYQGHLVAVMMINIWPLLLFISNQQLSSIASVSLNYENSFATQKDGIILKMLHLLCVTLYCKLSLKGVFRCTMFVQYLGIYSDNQLLSFSLLQLILEHNSGIFRNFSFLYYTSANKSRICNEMT